MIDLTSNFDLAIFRARDQILTLWDPISAMEVNYNWATLAPAKNTESWNDQSWFWSDEWQAGEREAQEDLKHGRYRDFETIDELLAFMNGKKKKASRQEKG